MGMSEAPQCSENTIAFMLWRVRILRRVAVLMMSAMESAPLKERPRAFRLRGQSEPMILLILLNLLILQSTENTLGRGCKTSIRFVASR